MKNDSYYIEELLWDFCWMSQSKVSIPLHHTDNLSRKAKTVFILSHDFDTSRTLFLEPTDVSFWDVNPAAEQTPLKSSGLVFCLYQRYRQKKHRSIGYGSGSCDLFFLDLSEKVDRNVIFSFSPDHWNSKCITLLFTIPPISHVLHT